MFKENEKVQYIEDGKIKTGIILKILGDRVVVSSGGILRKLTVDGVTEWEVPVDEDQTVEENKEAEETSEKTITISETEFKNIALDCINEIVDNVDSIEGDHKDVALLLALTLPIVLGRCHQKLFDADEEDA